ncbi:MAG: nucleotide exchange factor GrpE [Candidatus Nomurabacteria bacterium]|jgi:molecular chaperone GrpE|nr:nucleotide exchange factor GrpE [Candidatus Nomurabacteria bacterium]
MNKKDNKDEQIAELTADLQRTRADFENYRKQVELQKEQYGNVVKLTTVSKVLLLLDDIDRAIAVHPEQLTPLKKGLDKILSDLNLQKIPSDVGMDFDPDRHDAVAVEGDGESEKIAETLRTGYKYDGEILRPAMVRVAKQ